MSRDKTTQNKTKAENRKQINEIVHEFNYPSSRMFAFTFKK